MKNNFSGKKMKGHPYKLIFFAKLIGVIKKLKIKLQNDLTFDQKVCKCKTNCEFQDNFK